MASRIKKYTNVWIILSFMVLAWLSMALLLSTHSLFGTGDMPMHLQQLREVQLALNHHELVYYGINEFHGSAIMTLYPWLNMWPAVLLMDVIKNKVLVIYLYFAFNAFLTMIISYFSSLNFAKNKRISYFFAIFYGLSTLYVDYGFADMDWGELLTMTFLPLVIFGSIELLQDGRWLELSAGMTLIIYSHVLNTLLVTAFLILFMIINVFKFRGRMLVNLIKAGLLTTFATVVVWLPAIRLMRLNPNITTPPEYPLFGTPFKQIVSGAIDGKITYGVSFFALAGIVLGALCFLHLNRYTKQLYVISTLIVIMCSAWFPWHLAPRFLTMLQFTWRLYLIPEVWLSYVAAKAGIYIISNWPIFRKAVIKVPIIIIVFLVTLGIQLVSQQQLININGRAPILSHQFFRRMNWPYARRGRLVYIASHLGNHPHPNFKTPKNFRIKGNASYDSFFDQHQYFNADGHYWPSDAKIHYNDMNDRYIASRQGAVSRLYGNGYDHFVYKDPKALLNDYLPIIQYNGEAFHVTLDGRPMPTETSQHVLFVKRLPKGKHELSITPVKNNVYKVSYLSLILGILLYIALIIFKGVKIHRKI